jgi:uncharacterized protein
MPRNSTKANLLSPLSEEELDELDQFLMSDTTPNEKMRLDALDGYLTAIVIGPTTLVFDQWFYGIWAADEELMPKFKTEDEAQRVFDLIIRHMNSIITAFEQDPDNIEPIFESLSDDENDQEYIDAEMWANGFLSGFELCKKDWKPLIDDPDGAKAFAPIYLLGMANVTDEERALTETPEQRETLADLIPESIAWIYRFWLPYRVAMAERTLVTGTQRSSAKIGRNDPCPCGSGKKYKKCCGASVVLH